MAAPYVFRNDHFSLYLKKRKKTTSPPPHNREAAEVDKEKANSHSVVFFKIFNERLRSRHSPTNNERADDGRREE